MGTSDLFLALRGASGRPQDLALDSVIVGAGETSFPFRQGTPPGLDRSIASLSLLCPTQYNAPWSAEWTHGEGEHGNGPLLSLSRWEGEGLLPLAELQCWWLRAADRAVDCGREAWFPIPAPPQGRAT